MRLKYHRLTRPFARSATAAILAIAVALIWGAGVSLARGISATKYYQDTEGNVCVGLPETGGFGSKSCEWGSLSGLDNTGLGEKVMERNTGSENVGVGFDALAENEAGSRDTATGFFALLHNHGGRDNTATGYAADYRCSAEACKENTEVGSSALRNNPEGNRNAAFGFQALDWAEGVSGNENVGIGYKAGSKTEGGANNIDISNEGVTSDQRTTRIGTEGSKAEARAFVAGIYKKTITTPTCAVKVNSEGQLGCNPEENSTAIATFASKKAVASGKCLNYTGIGAAGTGACPAATTGWSTSLALAGPTPANGATVTNLYADTNAVVSGADTAEVEVIDNTTGASLLSCTVNSANKSNCSNASGSGPVLAGENIEVRVSAKGVSGENKLWRVRFRY
jgi:hypothetical protein